MVTKNKRALVVGASGKTGRLLVDQLLNQGVQVTAIARHDHWLTKTQKLNEQLNLVQESVLNLSNDLLMRLLDKVDFVFCALGHNVSCNGIWGSPRKLVTDAVTNICKAIENLKLTRPVKFVLMASTGCENKTINESPPLSQKLMVSLLRVLIPPHLDNECAVKFLSTNVGMKNSRIEWCIVRPDTLVDEENVSNYEMVPSPTKNAIFNSGKTSRVNVANAMAKLALDSELWQNWQGKMPVVYNRFS